MVMFVCVWKYFKEQGVCQEVVIYYVAVDRMIIILGRELWP